MRRDLRNETQDANTHNKMSRKQIIETGKIGPSKQQSISNNNHAIGRKEREEKDRN